MEHTTTLYLTTSEAAARLGLSRPALLRAARRGDIPVSQRTPGGRLRFAPADVDAYARRLRAGPAVRGDIVSGQAIAARARVESEEYFRALSAHASDLVTVLDARGVIHYASPSYRDILGYEPAELVGRDGQDFIHPEDRLRLREDITHRRAGARSVAIAYRVRHADGSYRTIEALTNNRLDDPAVRGIIVNSHDITAHVRLEEALRASEERLRAVVDNAPLVLFTLDGDGVFTLSAGRALETLGIHSDESVGRSVFTVYQDVPGIAAQNRRALQGETFTARVTMAGRIFETHYAPFRAEGGAGAGVIGVSLDVTERARAEEERARLAAIVECSDDAIIGTALDGTITSWNAGAERLSGYTAEEAVGRSIKLLFPREQQDEVAAILARLWRGGRGERSVDLEIVHQRLDGRRVPITLSVSPLRDATGLIVGTATIARDITERKRAEEELRRLALHDALTGLPNRLLFHDRLAHALVTAARHGTDVALLLLDLDRFKEINDSFGHHHGDRVLCQVATRLQQVVRAVDTVARLGGDEFAIILPGDDADGAAVAARKLAEVLDAPLMIEEQALTVGGSIGIAHYPDHGDDAGTLLRRADVAMYAAKRAKRPYIVYAPEHDAHGAERLALVSDLREAIASGKLELVYQPEVDLGSGRVHAVEALTRWRHPTRGPIAPDVFIPLAEETGLIQPLAEWALEEAIHQRRIWQDAGLSVPIAVNLSMDNLRDDSLPDRLARLLRAYAVAGTALRLEITETTLMSNPAVTHAVLVRLAALGVRFSVDDFGVGQSSLSALKRLPIDELKIDKSFVLHMTEDESDVVIVSSTVGLGHSLGLHVVAEGIENERTWALLRALECDVAQGYYLSRPLPPRDVERWLRDPTRWLGVSAPHRTAVGPDERSRGIN